MVVGDPATAAGVASVDSTNGLDVDVTRIIPGVGSTNLGKAEDAAHVDGDVGVMMLGVRNHFTGSTTNGDYAALSVGSYGDLNTLRRADLVRISVASSGLTTATTAYTTGDQVGTQFTITDAGRVSGGGGIVTAVTLIDASDVIGAFDVALFTTSVTLASDNAAFSISDSDALNLVALVQLAGAIDLGGNRIAQATNLAIPYVCSGSANLYAALITRSNNAVFAAGATSLQLVVYCERY